MAKGPTHKTVMRVPIYFVAHARETDDPGYFQGIVRCEGHEIHRTPYVYEDPQLAATIAKKELARGLSHLFSKMEFDYEEGYLQITEKADDASFVPSMDVVHP